MEDAVGIEGPVDAGDTLGFEDLVGGEDMVGAKGLVVLEATGDVKDLVASHGGRPECCLSQANCMKS